MIFYAFTLYDTKVGAYHQPFFFAHEAHAFRAVADLAADSSTHPGRHPLDFVLFRIGSYDDQTGQLAPADLVNYGTVHAIASAYSTSESQRSLKL